MTDALITGAASLAWLIVMFVPLERVFPARKQRFLRAGFATDLLFFFGQHLAFATVAVSVVMVVAPWMQPDALAPVRDAFAGLPLGAQIALVLLFGDFLAYWGHRLQHRVDVLWRFHSVHHTTLEVDWLAAHREHPLDGIYTQTLVNLPAFVLGFDLAGVMGLVAFRSLWAIFIHSNVRLPLGPLRYLVGSPALHHWHHAKDRDVGNYANLAPWIDLAFGTYYLPTDEPDELGVSESVPQDYLGLLLHPFLPRKPAHPDVTRAVAHPPAASPLLRP